MATVYTNNKARQYKQVVHEATKLQDVLSDELLQAAVHAVNSVAKYARTGRLRRQYKANMVETIMLVTAKEEKVLPAVEHFLLYVDVDRALDFLSSMTGIAVVFNQLSNDNPF